MGAPEKFYTVAENIHCTLIRKTTGKFVSQKEDGSAFILYKEEGKEKSFPVPRHFIEIDDWKNGKVKHMAAAMWQGYHGEGSAREEGIEYIRYWARLQESYGSAYLDLNVDEFSTDLDERIGLMKWLAGIVQEASSIPLSIDSSNFELLETGLSQCDPARGKPMVNSVSLERLEAVELAAGVGAVVIAGATGRESMPQAVEERVANCQELMGILSEAGLSKGDVFFDPLVFPVSVDKINGTAVIDSVKELRNIYGDEIHFAPGLSNISYGLPNRKLINTVFTYLCWEAGMDGGIADPRHINMKVFGSMDTSTEAFNLAKNLVLGEDEYGMQYIMASRDGKL